MNCLAYALRFWKDHPEYLLYYNSDHVINSNCVITGGSTTHWLPATDYGYIYFASAFRNLLDDYEQQLLKEYFNEQ